MEKTLDLIYFKHLKQKKTIKQIKTKYMDTSNHDYPLFKRKKEQCFTLISFLDQFCLLHLRPQGGGSVLLRCLPPEWKKRGKKSNLLSLTHAGTRPA